MPGSLGAGRGEHALRVALDTTYAGTNPTGVGLYSLRLAEALRAIAPAHHLNLRCYGPPCKVSSGRPLLVDIAQEWPFYTHGVLPVRLAAFAPDVVHSTSHIGPLWSAGRRILTVHDLIFLRRPRDYNPAWLSITRLLLPLVLRRASAVACDSQATRLDLVRRLGVRANRTVVIYPGIDPQPMDTVRVAPPLPRPYILCLGPWARRKNLEVVVQAFASLAPQHPDARLVITGGPAPGVQSYTKQELISLLPEHLRDRMLLPGYVDRDEIRGLLSGASVLAYPSVDEGFGLPPLEAMAAGVPVVVADTPAVVEATGGAALVAPSDDPSAWAFWLSLLLARQDVAGQLREAGLRRSARFTWEACAHRFVRLYGRLANRPVRGIQLNTFS